MTAQLQQLGTLTYGWASEDAQASATASNPTLVNIAQPIEQAAWGLAESIFQSGVNGIGTPVWSTRMQYNGAWFDLSSNQMQSGSGGYYVVVNIAQEIPAAASEIAASEANPNRGFYLNNGDRYFLTASQPGLSVAQLTGGSPFWTFAQAKSAGNTSVATATWAGLTGANAIEVVPAGVMVTLAAHMTPIDTSIATKNLGAWRVYTGEFPPGLGRVPIKHLGRWLVKTGLGVLSHPLREGFGATTYTATDQLAVLAENLLNALATSATSNPNVVNTPGQTFCSDTSVSSQVAAFQSAFNLNAASDPTTFGAAVAASGIYDAATAAALSKTIGVYTALSPPATFVTTAAPVACTGAAPAGSATNASTIDFPGVSNLVNTTAATTTAAAPTATTAVAPANYTLLLVTAGVLGLGALAYFAFAGKGK